jgi:hypothetical protein
METDTTILEEILIIHEVMTIMMIKKVKNIKFSLESSRLYLNKKIHKRSVQADLGVVRPLAE